MVNRTRATSTEESVEDPLFAPPGALSDSLQALESATVFAPADINPAEIAITTSNTQVKQPMANTLSALNETTLKENTPVSLGEIARLVDNVAALVNTVHGRAVTVQSQLTGATAGENGGGGGDKPLGGLETLAAKLVTINNTLFITDDTLTNVQNLTKF